MLFNSVTFLLFFCWVLLVHFSPLPWRLKKLHLLLASYVFYAAWNPPFILLLWLSTWVDWLVARKMAASEEPRTRRHWLWLSLTVNLGMLVVFKYAGFLLSNFNALIAVFGVQWQATDPGLILPMGISFFTFQTLSYTLDVYHRRMQPWDRFLDYALFVSFFPQLGGRTDCQGTGISAPAGQTATGHGGDVFHRLVSVHFRPVSENRDG